MNKSKVIYLLGVGVLVVGMIIGNFVIGSTTSEALPNDDKNIVSVQGEGNIKAIPDVAYITMGIETTNKNMDIAQKTNKENMNNIISAVIKLGIKKENIQTQNYSIYPDYQWENNKNVLNGYRVSNIAKIKITDIENAGNLIDTIVSNNANVVQDIQFSILDTNKAYQDALKDALKDAEDKAKIMTGYFGKKPLNPISIKELSNNYSPTPYTNAKASLIQDELSSSTSINPGEIEIKASVSVDFEY